MHRIPQKLLERPVSVSVIGCGGTGSAIAAGLVYLHQSLLAFGHPGGLHVTVYDGDTISSANTVRQAFTRAEVGLNKATVAVHRINTFWGLEWRAIPARIEPDDFGTSDIVIGCVDTRRARATINQICRRYYTGVYYWLDLGNNADDGQIVLGQPISQLNADTPRRLRTVAEMYPELIDPTLDDDALPSCSAAEALTRQAPFVNQVLANHALSMLARLFRHGTLDFHTMFVNLATGVTGKHPVPLQPQLSVQDYHEIRALAHSKQWEPLELMQAYELDQFEFEAITRRRKNAA